MTWQEFIVKINEPIFRITNLKKNFIEAWSLLGYGFVLGVVFGLLVR